MRAKSVISVLTTLLFMLIKTLNTDALPPNMQQINQEDLSKNEGLAKLHKKHKKSNAHLDKKLIDDLELKFYEDYLPKLTPKRMSKLAATLEMGSDFNPGVTFMPTRLPGKANQQGSQTVGSIGYFPTDPEDFQHQFLKQKQEAHLANLNDYLLNPEVQSLKTNGRMDLLSKNNNERKNTVFEDPQLDYFPTTNPLKPKQDGEKNRKFAKGRKRPSSAFALSSNLLQQATKSPSGSSITQSPKGDSQSGSLSAVSADSRLAIIQSSPKGPESIDLEFLSQFQNQYQKNGIFSTTEANERMKTIDPRAIDLSVLQMVRMDGLHSQEDVHDPIPTTRTTFRPKLTPTSSKRRVHVYLDVDEVNAGENLGDGADSLNEDREEDAPTATRRTDDEGGVDLDPEWQPDNVLKPIVTMQYDAPRPFLSGLDAPLRKTGSRAGQKKTFDLEERGQRRPNRRLKAKWSNVDLGFDPHPPHATHAHPFNTDFRSELHDRNAPSTVRRQRPHRDDPPAPVEEEDQDFDFFQKNMRGPLKNKQKSLWSSPNYPSQHRTDRVQVQNANLGSVESGEKSRKSTHLKTEDGLRAGFDGHATFIHQMEKEFTPMKDWASYTKPFSNLISHHVDGHPGNL